MKNYIENYIYEVTKRLPEEQRLEVETDLKANIYDMLPDDPSEEEIDKVLHELGSPRLIAHNYRDKIHHVIAPILYSDYVSVLKLVLIILGSITLISQIFENIIHLNNFNQWQTISIFLENVSDEVFSSLFFGFAVVTIVFWIMSYAHEKSNFLDKWKLKDLKEPPKPNKYKISRVETIVELVFLVIGVSFLTALIRNLDKIGWYENGILTEIALNKEVVMSILPLFIFAIVLNISIYIIKIIEQKYSLKLVVIFTISQIISLTALLVLVQHPDLINMSFLSDAATYSNYPLNDLIDHITFGIRIFSAIVIIITIIEIANYWRKFYKSKKV